ncbi:MAG TPA: pectate lyase [Longimicrobiales bacterium]|nr:pectate lyase [Longimicrobiales bacterium]
MVINLIAVLAVLQGSTVQEKSWTAYKQRSDSVRVADRAAIDDELKRSGKTAWTPAPTDQGFFLHDSMTVAWFATPRAAQLGDYIVSYQAPNGGWSKRMAFAHLRSPGEAYTSEDNATWLSTLDNGATHEQLEFLGRLIKAQDMPQYRASFIRGVEYLLIAQQPNGCWPQIFPLAGSYHDAITFNDDASVNALGLLGEVADGEHSFVPESVRNRSTEAWRNGLECILKTQVTVNGVKTVWGQQHDPITLQPGTARAYEHPSLSGRESAAILDFLMRIEKPSFEVVNAVHAGVAWFRKNAIEGFDYHFKGDLTPKAGAGPIWARFYELGTNRPIFSDRDGVVKYNLGEIGPERRYNYGWYTDEPVRTLKRYERWIKKYGREK